MKLLDFKLDKNIITRELSSIRDSLGAEFITFNSDVKVKINLNDSIKLQDNIMGSFKEIIENIDLKKNGYPLLDKNGNCRFLYIPDHLNIGYGKYKNEYKKVHITYCSKLRGMEEIGRGDRYNFTSEKSGFFEIHLPYNKKENKKLDVCKICIRAMNSNHNISQYGQFNNFNFRDFSEDFAKMYPPEFDKASSLRASSDYPANWSQISSEFRASKNWTCEECGRNCNYNKSYLDTHHINGVKSDCRPSNLKALCKDCHKKQPFHSHY